MLQVQKVFHLSYLKDARLLSYYHVRAWQNWITPITLPNQAPERYPPIGILHYNHSSRSGPYCSVRMRSQQSTHKPISSTKWHFIYHEIKHCVSEQLFNATRLVLSEGIQKIVPILNKAEVLNRYINNMSYLNSWMVNWNRRNPTIIL